MGRLAAVEGVVGFRAGPDPGDSAGDGSSCGAGGSAAEEAAATACMAAVADLRTCASITPGCISCNWSTVICRFCDTEIACPCASATTRLMT